MQQPNAFKVLRILHTALLIGMVIFNIVGIVLVQQNIVPASGEDFERIFQVVCILVSGTGLIAGFNLFKKKMIVARNSTGPGEQRMDLYRTACILWWAMIEGPGLLATIGYILTHNYAFFALGVFHLSCLFVFSPRKANIIVLLNLTPQEVARLEGGAAQK
ncbi:hypothetical protein A4H97_01695 [Niastella yeongjuensis]|uniref:Uncharacterized protein n=1 Tax=Niastella yeongjuensis TaxID=354355 RepID=A0A1V9EWS6_9BACT|nr:hypothetical protein [Niastella yeongjuensis]OQP50580.1 hypothetical protein A4H97_01695 [Niastella yeongjuensis]SEN27854.1 hypothetical protein SAMN05660816_00606 [Niastella yeongjuensis]